MSVWRRILFHALLASGVVASLLAKAAAQPQEQQPAADTTDSAPATRLVRTAPPGFEEYVQPEAASVPLVFEGMRIGAADARIDLSTLTFEDPEAVVALIPDVTDRLAVAAALSGPLPLRADLACGDAPRANCGRLAPDAAAIIYDRAAREALVFVNPNLRAFTAQLDRLRPAGVSPAFLGGGSLFFSGDTGRSGDVRYTLNLHAVAGAGHRHILARGSLSTGRQALDAAALRSVRDGRDFRLGLFDGAPSPFRNTERLIGLRWGGTLDDLANSAGAYDAPLVVQLTAPARIEAFAGDRLIGSARYPAGTVKIDTSGFPSGAYLVRLRIDEAGSVREEERFFSRETAFPPVGAPQTFVAFGARQSAAGFDVGGEGDLGAELQLGHRRRFGNGLAGGGAVYLRENSAAVESSVALARPGLDLSLSGILSTRDEAALAASVRATPGPWRFSADVRRILIPVEPQGAPRLTRDPARHLLYSERAWQTSFSASRRIGAANISLFGSWRDGARSGDSWSAQPSIDAPIAFAGGRANLRFSGSFSETSEQVRFEVSFQRSVWRGGSLTLRGGARALDNGGGLAEASLQHSLQAGHGLRGSMGLRYRRDGSTDEATANGRFQGPLGSASVDYTADFARGGGTYFGTGEAGFALTASGLALGASGRPEAAVVFVNRSTAPDATAQGLVGGGRVGQVPPGGRRMHAVRAFATAAASMIPAEGAPIATSARPQLARLFPGNVAIVEAEFVDVVAAFGRLIDDAGAPVVGVWLDSGLSQDRTDADGRFQLDVSGRAEISARHPDGRLCHFSVDAAAARGAPVLPLDSVTCRW